MEAAGKSHGKRYTELEKRFSRSTVSAHGFNSRGFDASWANAECSGRLQGSQACEAKMFPGSETFGEIKLRETERVRESGGNTDRAFAVEVSRQLKGRGL